MFVLLTNVRSLFGKDCHLSKRFSCNYLSVIQSLVFVLLSAPGRRYMTGSHSCSGAVNGELLYNRDFRIEIIAKEYEKNPKVTVVNIKLVGPVIGSHVGSGFGIITYPKLS